MGFWKWLIEGREQKAAPATVQQLVVQQMKNQAVWQTDDYEKFGDEGYLQNVIVFTSINKISSSCTQVPFGVFTGDGDDQTQLDGDSIARIIKRPNPQMSWRKFVIEVINYLLIAGNSYIKKIGPITGENTGVAKELWPLRPDRVKIIKNKAGQVVSYEVDDGNGNIEKFPVDPITGDSQILHIDMFNPTDDYYGAGPIKPSASQIDSFNLSSIWNANLLNNQGRPGLLYLMHEQAGDEQLEQVSQMVQEIEGPENAGVSVALGGVHDVKPYGFTPTDMDWTEGTREMARKIALAFQVPPMLLGIPGDNTYSNMQEARQAFWEETVIFYLDMLKDELNWWLIGDDETKRIDYSIDNVPALAPRREVQWNRAKEATHLTTDEKRELTGYEDYDGEGAEKILVSATQVSIDDVTAPIDADETVDEDKTGDLYAIKEN